MNSRDLPVASRLAVRWLAIGLIGAGLAVATRPVEAGSVFMKNGYIIQGPIVEENDEAVVLGWENGKVTLFLRFVESVSFDPGEKERLDQYERMRVAELEAAERQNLDGSDQDELEDLPADLDVFLRLYSEETQKLSPDRTVVRDVSDAGDGGTSTPEATVVDDSATVTPVDDTTAKLADRVFPEGREFSIVSPEGWEVKNRDGIMVLTGSESDEGVVPSLNAVRLPANELSFDEQVQLVKEQQDTVLEDFEVLAEGARLLSGGQAFEVIGRGRMNDRTMVVHQVIVAGGEDTWLFSGFSQGATNDRAYDLIDQVFSTLEFSEN